MILEKRDVRPSPETRILRIAPETLADPVFRNVMLLHVNVVNGEFVVGEGGQRYVALPAPAETYTLHTVGNTLFGASSSGAIQALSDGASQKWTAFSSPMRFLIGYTKQNGNTYYIAGGAGGLYLLAGPSSKEFLFTGQYSTGAVHYERCFAAAGRVIRYCVPLDPTDWKETSEGAGSFELPDDGNGDVLDLVSFRDRLYCFRERGITCVRAHASDLNFVVTSVPCGMGNIVQGTARCLGDKVYFFATSGLCAFDGSSCEVVDPANAAYTPRTDGTSASAVYEGRYYANVLYGTEKCILVYDPSIPRIRFIRFKTDTLAAAPDRLYAVMFGAAYILQGTGFPIGSYEARVRLRFDLGESDWTVDAARSDSTAVSRLALKPYNGVTRDIYLTAGVKERFPSVQRGRVFDLSWYSTSSKFCAGALDLYLRRIRE